MQHNYVLEQVTNWSRVGSFHVVSAGQGCIVLCLCWLDSSLDIISYLFCSSLKSRQTRVAVALHRALRFQRSHIKTNRNYKTTMKLSAVVMACLSCTACASNAASQDEHLDMSSLTSNLCSLSWTGRQRLTHSPWSQL